MSAASVLVVYIAIGVAAAVVVAFVQRRPVAGLTGPFAAVAIAVLWPFLVPAIFCAGAAAPSSARGSSPHRADIDDVARRLAVALERAPCLGDEVGRPQQIVDSVLARLRQQDARIADLQAVQADLPASVRERLQAIERAGEDDLGRGLRLLEELVGRLTLLRFADLTAAEADSTAHESVEDLLGRIEALTEYDQIDATAIGQAQAP